MRPPPPPLKWISTGRYRLAPNGEFVMLMMEEKRPYPNAPELRWRPAAPADAMALVGVEITAGTVAIGAKP